MEFNSRHTDTSATRVRNVTGLRLVTADSRNVLEFIHLPYTDADEVPMAIAGLEFRRRELNRVVPRDGGAILVEAIDVLTQDVLASGQGEVRLDLLDSGRREQPGGHVIANPKCEACIADDHPSAWHPWLSDANVESVEDVTGKQLGGQRCGCPCAGDWYTVTIAATR